MTRTCRGAQLFGAWTIEPERFARMVGFARAMTMEQVLATHAAAVNRQPARPTFDTVGDGVAMIDVSGPLTKTPSSFQSLFGGTATIDIRRGIRAAVADPDIKSILLRIDSPGGIVDGVADLVDDIREALAIKPVWAYIEDLGASAGYWIASAADRIVANRTSLVGSIGVFSVLEDTSGAAELAGIKVHVVRTGPNKGAGVDGAPVTEQDIADAQRIIDSTFNAFAGDVGTARGLDGEALDAVTTGQVWIAPHARKLGLVDSIDTLANTIGRLGRAKVRRVGAAGSAAKARTTMHPDIDPDDTPSPAANAAKPASIAQLRAEFPGADADFYLGCAEAGMTIAQATKAYAAKLAKENIALKASLAEKSEEARKIRLSGARPLSDAPAPEQPRLSAKDEIENRVAALVGKGMARHEAHRRVMRENPELREQLVAASNT